MPPRAKGVTHDPGEFTCNQDFHERIHASTISAQTIADAHAIPTAMAMMVSQMSGGWFMR